MLFDVLEENFFFLWLFRKFDGLGPLLVAQLNVVVKCFLLCETMQAIEAVVGCFSVFGAVAHKTTEALYQTVVTIIPFTNQEEVDVPVRVYFPCFVEWVDLVFLVEPKDVDAEVV